MGTDTRCSLRCGAPVNWRELFVRQLDRLRAGELAGSCELDWFAVDAAGSVGVFITASWGRVPRAVVGVSDDAYCAAMSAVFAAEGFSIDFPNDAPEYLGLYVYEWVHGAPRTEYRRVRGPTESLPSGAVAGVAVPLDVVFALSPVVDVGAVPLLD